MKKPKPIAMSLRRLTLLKKLLALYAKEQLEKKEWFLVVRCRDMEQWIQEDIDRIARVERQRAEAGSVQ
jgi:hypothetical protein